MRFFLTTFAFFAFFSFILCSLHFPYGDDHHLFTLTMGMDSFAQDFDVMTTALPVDPFKVSETVHTSTSNDHVEHDHAFLHNFDHFRPTGFTDLSPATAFMMECNPFAFTTIDHNDHSHDHFNHDHHHHEFHMYQMNTESHKTENPEAQSEESQKLVEFINKANTEWHSGSFQYLAPSVAVAPAEDLKKKVSVLLKPSAQPTIRRQLASSVFSSAASPSNLEVDVQLKEDIETIEKQEVKSKKANELVYYLMAVVLGMLALIAISFGVFFIINRSQKIKAPIQYVDMSMSLV